MHAWAQYGFMGGHVALDFVNTIDDEGKTRAASGIPEWSTLLDWAVAARVLNKAEASRLARQSGSCDAATELQALHELRELAWEILQTVARAQNANPEQLESLGAAIQWALARAALETVDDGFRWYVDAQLGLETVRARLLVALNGLLVQAELDRLRECGRCTSLFLDRGRGAGRRWCRMQTCGNRAKVERFRSRSR